jgi:CRP/FNR family transcriptional regulator
MMEEERGKGLLETFDQITEFSTSGKMIDELKKIGSIRSLKSGDLLIQEQSRIHFIPIILKGSLRVYQTDNDYKEILLYHLKEGDTCIMSYMSGLYNEVSKLKAVANEDSEVLLLPIDQAGKLMKNYPEWIEYILRIYHQRFEELLEVVNAVAFKKMDERLLNFLNKEAEIANTKHLKVTHEVLANELGTARVVISRLLKQMENEGLVELGRNQITLL